MLYPSDGIGDPVGERYKALSLEVCPIELANDPS